MVRALLGNQIADSLRRDILLGVIRPGTRLSQQRLCEQFGTSRMPVRDGLRVLVHEGLIMTDARQHTIVAPLSRADLLDSYQIEGTLAGMAASRASRLARPENLVGLRNLHEAMQAAQGRDVHLMAQLNWSLHRTINRMAQSRKILSAMKMFSLDVPKDFLIEMPDWGGRSNAEHAEILAAMGERKHDWAGRLMVRHIVDSGKGLIDYLESQGLRLNA